MNENLRGKNEMKFWILRIIVSKKLAETLNSPKCDFKLHTKFAAKKEVKRQNAAS